MHCSGSRQHGYSAVSCASSPDACWRKCTKHTEAASWREMSGSFLTVKRGRVNKGIRNTVLHESDMFFAYNNGIAATASSVSVKQTSKGLTLLSATDLQIVNGAQTTASLAAAQRNDKASLARVHVPMKLSVVSPERSGVMIPLSPRSRTAKTRVSDARLFSNHDFHRRLEEISRRLWAPATRGAQHETHWFYERTRGQYMYQRDRGYDLS